MLPEIMLAEDVAEALGLKSASAARRLMNSGRLGLISRLGGRVRIRRSQFMKAIEAMEYDPASREAQARTNHLRRGMKHGLARLQA